jgi:dolichyl-phosphate-mannose--protein O-mannosyl transferase
MTTQPADWQPHYPAYHSPEVWEFEKQLQAARMREQLNAFRKENHDRRMADLDSMIDKCNELSRLHSGTARTWDYILIGLRLWEWKKQANERYLKGIRY